jgi:hypothetical protein
MRSNDILPRAVQDRLGKLIIRDHALSLSHVTLHDFLRERRGISNLLSPALHKPTSTHTSHTIHPATPFLRQVAKHGFPVLMTTPPWTLAQRDAAVHRGPHQSSHQHREFLREELADMVERATWVVLPYSRLRHMRNLRISPMGVVPQHERRPRPIVDYSFSGVNTDTVKLAPAEAMQFGRALERIIRLVVLSNPKFGHVHFMKLDIADGFYRVWLRVHDVPTLAVAIPTLPGEPPMLALPLALPMGWTQSPPAFCAVTETIADQANRRLRHRGSFLCRPHPLERLASTPATASVNDVAMVPPRSGLPPLPVLPVPPSNSLLVPFHRPLRAVDVFVDDFIGLAQGQPRSLRNTRRLIMHAVDSTFRPLMPDDLPSRTEPISVAKLLKGDADWSTTKKILGWEIDSVSMTLTLPARRLARLHELLASISKDRKRMSLSTYHQLLGELRSMALALPGARGLFSHLQLALRSRQGTRLRLSPSFHAALDDFRTLVDSLGARPTRLYELVPTTPSLIGAHDASGVGAGGVWIPHASAHPRQATTWLLNPAGNASLRRTRSRDNPVPIVWRVPFPSAVSSRLRTFDQPTGDLNNSQLELLGGFLHDSVAATCFDIRERTLKSHTDNLATLYWSRRGSVTTTSPTATILRHHALHQRFHRYLSLKDYLPGDHNNMADDASRLWTLSDSAFLAHFNSTYPQTQPWQLFRPSPKTISSAISALRTSTSKTALWLPPPPPPLPIGPSGPSSVTRFPSLRLFATSKIPSPSSKSLHFDTGVDSSTPVDALSAAAPWRVPYGALDKRLLVWGPKIPASTPWDK